MRDNQNVDVMPDAPTPDDIGKQEDVLDDLVADEEGGTARDIPHDSAVHDVATQPKFPSQDLA